MLHAYALDLSGTADDVARNVHELADWVAGRADPKAQGSRDTRATVRIP